MGKRMECYRIKEDEDRMLIRRAGTYADLETAVQKEFAGSFAWQRMDGTITGAVSDDT